MSQKLLVNEYIEKVLSGEIVASKKVISACQRHLNDLKRSNDDTFPWEFDEEKAFRPVKFIEMFCSPSKGNYEKLEMQPWQHFVIGSIYGWVHKKTRLRRYKEALIMLGRKNGKSAIASGLAVYTASKDGEKGADVHLLANSMKQARVVFDECAKMIKSSKWLKDSFRPLRDVIHYDETFSRIEPQAADSEKLDGLNSHCQIFDELHEAKDYKLLNVMKNSTASREQPILFIISTAGYQLSGPLVDYYEKGSDVLAGALQDERCFYFIAELDKEDNPEDIESNPSLLYKANPNLGVSIDPDTMLEEWKTRKHIPAERNDFITKRLNVFVQSDEQGFLDYEVLKRNDKVIELDTLIGRPCVGSMDLSQTEDFTSACLEFILDSGEIFVLSHSWIPEAKVTKDNEKIPYRELEKQGLLSICPGDYIDYKYIYDWFIEKSKIYSIEKIMYDPANAYRLIEELKNHGFVTEVVRQGFFTLSPALKDAKELFLDGKVIFNNNKLFLWYLNNVRLKPDSSGNYLPQKQGRYRKIDGFAAFLNAHVDIMKKMVKPQGNGDIKFISMKDL